MGGQRSDFAGPQVDYNKGFSLGTSRGPLISVKGIVIRGGQTFPKSMEIRNSVAFHAFFSIFFRPFFSVVAESVSEQLLQRIDG